MYFDQVAQNWDEMVQHDPAKVQFLMDLLPLLPEARVLDVGSGTGVLVPYLLEKAPRGEIVEMDLSANMLEVARQKFPAQQISFVCGDAQQPHPKLGLFDGVIAFSMFPHFADQRAATRGLWEKLRPGGLLAVLHSQSREELNRLHGGASESSIQNDLLPPVATLAGWMEELGAEVLCQRDDGDYYYCVGRK